jgi:hypothetical protein
MKSLSFILISFLAFSCTEPELYQEEETKGCTNPQSVNYSPNAILDDGSCVTITEKQNSLMVKFTATWCGPCGEWGGPAFVSAVNSNKSRVLGISLQVNDNLTTSLNGPMVDQFSSKWQYTGTPNFAVNNDLIGTNVNQATSIIGTTSQISPKMGVGLHVTTGAGPNKGKMNINAYIKSYENSPGNYHLAVYFLSREIIASQKVGSTFDPSYVHHHVLLGPATLGGAWGEEIITNGSQKGQVFRWAKAVAYDSSWKLEDLEIVAVIWKKNPDGTFSFVNCTNNR